MFRFLNDLKHLSMQDKHAKKSGREQALFHTIVTVVTAVAQRAEETHEGGRNYHKHTQSIVCVCYVSLGVFARW